MKLPLAVEELINFLNAKYQNTDRTDITELFIDIIRLNDQLPLEPTQRSEWLPHPSTVLTIISQHALDLIDFQHYLVTFRDNQNLKGSEISDQAFIAFVNTYSLEAEKTV